MKILKSKKLITVLAMLLMVATVVGMGTMTYSRYVTSKGMDTPESATVADWGYVLSINSENLFGKQYEDNAVNESFVATTEDKIDVKTAGTVDIVAPGTSGSMTITVSGNAEVLAQLAIAVDNAATKDVVLVYKTTAEGAEVTYNPIKWTLTKKVGDAAATTVGEDNTTLANIVSSLQGQGSKIEAGTSIAETVYTLSWAWALDGEDIDDTNKMDTALGMLAASKKTGSDIQAADIQAATGLIVVTEKTNTTLSVQISASIIQIQD